MGSRSARDGPSDGAAPGMLLLELVPASAIRVLDAGSALFRQGDTVREVFVVEKGCVRLRRHTVEGVGLTLQTAGAGALLATASLFADRYHCDAVADRPSQVHVFPRRAVLDALANRPEAARSVMAALAAQVIELRTLLELRNIRSARQRVWSHLALAADPEGRVATPDPLKRMAEALGLTPEALYRTLAALERDGAIRRSAGMIRIMRRDAPDVGYRTS